MPSKEFRAHLREAVIPGQYRHLTRVQEGEFEGSIAFVFSSQESEEIVEYSAIVSDDHDYPQNHSFVVFATSENANPAITKALDMAQKEGTFNQSTIHELLAAMEDLTLNALNAPQEPTAHSDTDDFDAFGDSDFDDFDSERPIKVSFLMVSAEKLREKMCADLRDAKAAGFRIGLIREPGNPFLIVSISYRISRLGISEDAMQAWKLERQDYFVLLIRYTKVYVDMKDVFELGDIPSQDSDAPSLPEASSKASREQIASDLRSCFISEPLQKLLNERFFPIAKLRHKFNFSWTGAELFFQNNQGMISNDDNTNSPDYQRPDDWVTPAPDIFQKDHFAKVSPDLSKMSLPLVAMQYVLRHFAKCGEFCLVCHCKTFNPFETLKPYVCSNGLCLYQYIGHGMGSNLEHTIRTQPKVVDLLVSLVYASTSAGRLEDFPTGLGLKVPRLETPKYYDAFLDPETMTLTGMEIGKNTFTVGTWVAFGMPGNDVISAWSSRITSIDRDGGFLILSEPVPWQETAFRKVLPRTKISGEQLAVRFALYDTEFDDLTVGGKQSAIRMLLNSLPDVVTMESYLKKSGPEKTFSSWDRLNPAALDTLRWIVASNRSCIMQDDTNPDHLVKNMPGYVQFRLIQGAPDKEHRFMQAVNQHSMLQKPRCPTLFAWHGSDLHNWHNILRQGLHFDQIVHGRSQGNGVYFSNQFTTSLGYSRGPEVGGTWPGSNLHIARVISLNEIVNCPRKFTSVRPYFVVDNLQWIQPRYLFVGTTVGTTDAASVPSVKPKKRRADSDSISILPQDPQYVAFGPNGAKINIPMSALSYQRRQALSKVLPVHNDPRARSSKKPSRVMDGVPHDDDLRSVASEAEDIALLLSDDEVLPMKNLAARPVTNKMAFEPDKLTSGSVSLLEEPQYSDSKTTSVLQRHLKAVLKLQKTERLDELGWYVNKYLLQTVYQWIVELHSFEKDLPLAKDLEKRKLQSVILEVRFPHQFPMSPPFVRVIRPRFREFAQGGGGHVTNGGALCMELLTNSGWSPVASMESVFLQIRMAITSTDPWPARLSANDGRGSYTIHEAVSAYKRACQTHGWAIPTELPTA
ncbi:hypothetical protein N7468_009107 [Penicillium chermesinum]|uniref:UBC core domain-containing protein n=1 Tax=Penicillium chermesinum TaxID=63820 RepID=A0A9W9TEP7_9EURO|nr:uncharacterized protein N7468_009107 [Penicillium chermesinum]KAJ5219903.1 hypothetical protein N7468_009107 [Penicillium chermesinum]